MRTLVVGLLLIASTQRHADGQSPQIDTKGSVRVRVLMPDGTPAENAHVYANRSTYIKGYEWNQAYETDKDGWVTVDLPKKLIALRLWARKPGCAPLFLDWDPRELAKMNKPKLVPDKFEFKLPAGTKMSGLVRNEDGQPIEGVDVEVRYDAPDAPTGQIGLDAWLAEGSKSNGPHPALRTDKNGRWTLNNVPAGGDAQVLVKVRHPDYVDDSGWGALQKEQGVRMDQYRDGTAVIAMKRGIRLRGLVVDAETGKPIKDAIVVFGDDPYMQEGSQEVKTGEKGWYEFPPQHPTEKLRVTVLAPGYAPAMKQPELSKRLEKRRLRLDASFRMKRGKTIRIQFMDGESPVPNVFVRVFGWRGVHSLHNHRHSNVLNTQIPLRANKGGLFEWMWAPEDAVSIRFSQAGYDILPPKGMEPTAGGGFYGKGYSVVARDKPYVVQLKKREAKK